MQECKHGGHASHMEAWFAEHAVCPVADCNCSCASIDSDCMLQGTPH